MTVLINSARYSILLLLLLLSRTSDSLAESTLDNLLQATFRATKCLASGLSCSRNALLESKYYEIMENDGQGHTWIAGYLTREFAGDESTLGGIAKDIACSVLAQGLDQRLASQIIGARRLEFLFAFNKIFDDFVLIDARVTTPTILRPTDDNRKPFVLWKNLENSGLSLSVTSQAKRC